MPEPIAPAAKSGQAGGVWLVGLLVSLAVAALYLRTAARDIVFTSGGTESNNAAIFGAVPSSGRHHIVTTAIEHPSVLEPVQELERRGHEVTVVPSERTGEVRAERVIEALRPDTRLVAMMLANNETGVIQPVAEVARNQCLVCHVTVTSSGMQALRKGEEIVQCENCGRILVIA